MTNYTSDFTGAEIDAGIALANSAQQPPAEGSFVDGDKTKLDGIETGATADQTASEIRALVESATDSNVFTDADHSKLNGIETGADVTDAANVAAAGAVMESDFANLAQVLAFDPADYATAAQGGLADSAVQPGDLSAVATSGDYDDLTGTPNPADYATSAQGSLADSAVQPGDLSTVATTGSYGDLSGTPTLATVATTGDYSDLSNLPSIPSDIGDLSNVSATAATTGQVLKWDGTQWAPAADDTSGGGGGSGIELTDLSVGAEGTPSGDGSLSYNSTTGVFTYTPPDLSSYATSASLSAVATSGAYADLTGTPSLATVATTGAYADLTGTPDPADYATAAQGSLADTAVQPGDLATVATTGAYADLTGTPSLATVATSGAYSDLTGTPDLSTYVESDTTGVSGADAITNIISLTQAEYDAITPDASTVYVISN